MKISKTKVATVGVLAAAGSCVWQYPAASGEFMSDFVEGGADLGVTLIEKGAKFFRGFFDAGSSESMIYEKAPQTINNLGGTALIPLFNEQPHDHYSPAQA